MGRTLLAATVECGLACTALAASETTHSGELVAVSRDGHDITVKELGPWDGHHQVIRSLSIILTPTTRIEMVSRAPQAEPGAWIGGFRQSPVTAAELRPGHYVTIKVRPDARHHLSADTVEIIHLGEALGAKG
jgi:hypothetical protein